LSRERKESCFYKLLTSSPPAEQREHSRGRRASAVGAMLRQDELAFIEAISNIELSTVFLQELRKTVALKHNSGVGSDALTSHDSPQFQVSKRKAEELSFCYSGPSRCRSLRCTCPRPKAPGGYYHPGHVG